MTLKCPKVFTLILLLLLHATDPLGCPPLILGAGESRK
jgi:hypothetical protein